MKDNGTDRDVALLILSGLDSCATLVASINDNLYVPHIVTQPTDQEGAVGDTVTFTVVANNVASYQWQLRYHATVFSDSGAEGNKTATVSVEVSTSARYEYEYRCKITGKDGSVIYTNIVHVLEPEAEG